MDKICGIYCIKNLINGKEYVGLSKNCLKRWSDHYSKSINSQKIDDLKKPLYMAMRKYGRDNFSFRILEQCDEKELKEKEIYWINKLNTYKNGYNATPGGDMPPEQVLRGEQSGHHKLTLEQVIRCRHYYSQGLRSKEIWEKEFKDIISYSGFQRMWLGKTWSHVLPETFNNNPHPRKKLTDDTIRDIKKMFSQGKTCAEVYHFYNEIYSRTTINDIYNNKRYSDII